VAQILLFLGIPVKTPVNVWIDNVGAIFMIEHRTSSSRTRHMDAGGGVSHSSKKRTS